MNDFTEQRERQVRAFQSHLDLMVRRRHEEKKGDCFIVFDEGSPTGWDRPELEEACDIPANEAAIGSNRASNDGPPGIQHQSLGASFDGSNEPSSDRYIQFCFGDRAFYMELTNTTLFPPERERMLKERSGFFYVRETRRSWMSFDFWTDLVQKWDPVHKEYVNSDTRAAAEDMAFIWFSLWKFPVDWQLYFTAGKFSAEVTPDWAGSGPVLLK